MDLAGTTDIARFVSILRAVRAAATGFDGFMASCTPQGTLRGFAVVTHWSLGAVWCAGGDGY